MFLRLFGATLIWIGVFAAALWPRIGQAAEPPAEAVSALDFARSLYREGDLYGAEGEVKRFLFHLPGHPRAPEAGSLLARIQSELEVGRRESGPRSFTHWAPGRPDLEPAGQDEAGRNGIAAGLVRFYQTRLRTFRDPDSSCPSYPSCSEYALRALSKHGTLLGTFIYVDRFWRETTTAGRPPYIWVKGRRLHFDPLEQNDYWLETGRGSP
ncbi:MAG: membrane protein insertion efficiency factor YidD [Thermodesulfobacteriota bacterium]